MAEGRRTHVPLVALGTDRHRCRIDAGGAKAFMGEVLSVARQASISRERPMKPSASNPAILSFVTSLILFGGAHLWR